MLLVHTGCCSIVFDSKKQAAAICIAECYFGINDFAVGKFFQIAFELNGEGLVFWDCSCIVPIGPRSSDADNYRTKSGHVSINQDMSR